MKKRYKFGGGFLLLLAIAVGVLGFVISRTDECGPSPSLTQGSATMKAIVARCYGSPDVLEYVDVERPEPGADEVLVKVHAASVNPLDWHYMRGSPYIMRLMSGLGSPSDTTVGVDFAGVVESVGDDVTRFQVGDAVFGGRGGAFAEYLAVPEDRAMVLKPENVSFEQAAAMPIAAVTALQALRDVGKIETGDRVLINGASGGVGTYAVQLAKSFGAHVTGVCSTRNVELVTSIGADRVIDYKTSNYTEADKKYDLIIDNVGNHSLSANRGVLEEDGALVIVGAAKGDWIGPLVPSLKAPVVAPFVSQEVTTILAELTAEDLKLLADLAEDGGLRSVIDRRYTLGESADAIRYSETGRARGKIIVNVL